MSRFTLTLKRYLIGTLIVKLRNMKSVTVELTSDPNFGGYTARLPDIPAYGEGETEEAASADLMDALCAYVEEFGLEDAWSRFASQSKVSTLRTTTTHPNIPTSAAAPATRNAQ